MQPWIFVFDGQEPSTEWLLGEYMLLTRAMFWVSLSLGLSWVRIL